MSATGWLLSFRKGQTDISVTCAWHVIRPLLVTQAQLMTPGIGRNASCALGDLHLGLCVIYGCSQPRELWFIDFNHVHVHMHVVCRFNVFVLALVLVSLSLPVETWLLCMAQVSVAFDMLCIYVMCYAWLLITETASFHSVVCMCNSN